MKYQLSISFFLLILIVASVSGQEPFDCMSAIEVCDNSPISISYEEVEGTIEEEFPGFCDLDVSYQYLLDNNTIWFRYQFKTEGTFYFTISSDIEENDIDFVVFQTESKSCEDLESIRCMFTGSTLNGPSNPICIGDTGLSPSSTDISEMVGCTEEDDNFLAQLEVESGDVIYLAVISFSAKNEYMIEHGGSAEISCGPVGFNEHSAKDFEVYPNPVYDLLHIEMPESNSIKYNLELLNSIGGSILKKDFVDQIDLDISHFPIGVYHLRIIDDEYGYFHKKVIKIK